MNNTGCGIALYNNLAGGALAGNVIVGNTLIDNGQGISFGSDDNGGNAPAVANVIAGNVISGSARGGVNRNGDGKENVILGNSDADGLGPSVVAAASSIAVIFDPLGTEHAAA